MWDINYIMKNELVKKEEKNQFPPIGSVRKINNQWYRIVSLYLLQDTINVEIQKI